MKAFPVPIKQQAQWTHSPPRSFGEEINLLVLAEIAAPFHVFPARSLIVIPSEMLQLIRIFVWLIGWMLSYLVSQPVIYLVSQLFSYSVIQSLCCLDASQPAVLRKVLIWRRIANKIHIVFTKLLHVSTRSVHYQFYEKYAEETSCISLQLHCMIHKQHPFKYFINLFFTSVPCSILILWKHYLFTNWCTSEFSSKY